MRRADRRLGRLIECGVLRRIYERYGIWNEAQNELAGWDPRSDLQDQGEPRAARLAAALALSPLAARTPPR